MYNLALLGDVAQRHKHLVQRRGQYSNRSGVHVVLTSADSHSLTYLKVGVHSQGFVYQTMTTRVPGLQVHDVTLCFLVSQRDGGEL